MIRRRGIRCPGILYRTTLAARYLSRSYTVPSSGRHQSEDRLRVLFCGSDEFSAFSLKALAKYATLPESNIKSIDVVTRKDKRAGRGLKSVRSPFIKSLTEELQLPLHQIDTFTGWTPPTYGQSSESANSINLIIAVSFGLLVPPRILRSAAYGGINIHPSLLPRLKGAAPIQWTILNGCRTTGVSLQTLHASKFDEGVVMDQIPVPIQEHSTCTFNQLRDQLGPVGAELLIRGLRGKRYMSEDRPLEDTNPEQTSYAPKIKKQHAAINPALHDSHQILRMQRALKNIWAHAQNVDGEPSRVLTHSVIGGAALQKHLDLIPATIRSTAASLPIGVPYGIVRGRRQPTQAGCAPLFMNTTSGTLGINYLTIGGAPQGSALVSSARGRLLEGHAHTMNDSGEVYNIYKFRAPLRGEPDGLPTIDPEDQ
jgi:methionyl-tRNA formyltransferase